MQDGTAPLPLAIAIAAATAQPVERQVGCPCLLVVRWAAAAGCGCTDEGTCCGGLPQAAGCMPGCMPGARPASSTPWLAVLHPLLHTPLAHCAAGGGRAAWTESGGGRAAETDGTQETGTRVHGAEQLFDRWRGNAARARLLAACWRCPLLPSAPLHVLPYVVRSNLLHHEGFQLRTEQRWFPGIKRTQPTSHFLLVPAEAHAPSAADGVCSAATVRSPVFAAHCRLVPAALARAKDSVMKQLKGQQRGRVQVEQPPRSCRSCCRQKSRRSPRRLPPYGTPCFLPSRKDALQWITTQFPAPQPKRDEWRASNGTLRGGRRRL